MLAKFAGKKYRKSRSFGLSCFPRLRGVEEEHQGRLDELHSTRLAGRLSGGTKREETEQRGWQKKAAPLRADGFRWNRRLDFLRGVRPVLQRSEMCEQHCYRALATKNRGCFVVEGGGNSFSLSFGDRTSPLQPR